MSNTEFRQALQSLPFVRETAQGLEPWCVDPPASRIAGLIAGRDYARLYLEVVHRHGCASFTYHLDEAWSRKPKLACPVQIGFVMAFGEALRAAPADATPALQVVGPIAQAPPREALAALPFVREIDGSLDCWVPRVSGDWSQDQATGRHYAARLCAAIQAAQAPFLLPVVARAIRQDAARRQASEGVLVGMLDQITEIAAAAPALAPETVATWAERAVALTP